MTKAHVHAENMRLYAEDAAKTDKPWELWEARAKGYERSKFHSADGHPAWSIGFEYRRKPRVITVGNHSWPEPMKEAPGIGTELFCFSLNKDIDELSYKFTWHDIGVDYDVLQRGIVHTTKEAAQAHAEALIAISKGDI